MYENGTDFVHAQAYASGKFQVYDDLAGKTTNAYKTNEVAPPNPVWLNPVCATHTPNDTGPGFIHV